MTEDEIKSLREWLSSWGSGPNWTDKSGLSIPLAKTTLIQLLDDVADLRCQLAAANERAHHNADDCCKAVAAAAREQSPGQTDDQILAATVAGSAMMMEQLREANERADRAEADRAAARGTCSVCGDHAVVCAKAHDLMRQKMETLERMATRAEQASELAEAINADLHRWALQLVENDGAGAVYNALKAGEARDQLRALLYYREMPGRAVVERLRAAEGQAAGALERIVDLTDALAKIRINLIPSFLIEQDEWVTRQNDIIDRALALGKDVCRWCGQSESNHVNGIGAARDCTFAPGKDGGGK